MIWLDSITDSLDMNLSKPWEIAKGRESLVCCNPWGCRVSRDLATGQQQHSPYVIHVKIMGLYINYISVK